jgi:hypothetical protein
VREDGRLVGGRKCTQQKGMEETRANGKELSHSAHGNGINELILVKQKTQGSV